MPTVATRRLGSGSETQPRASGSFAAAAASSGSVATPKSSQKKCSIAIDRRAGSLSPKSRVGESPGSPATERYDIGGSVSASKTLADPCLITDLLKPLSHCEPHVRQAACQALGKTECRGDPRVLRELLARLENDRDNYVRQAAATALGQVSCRGDETVLSLLTARSASDEDPGVRRLSCLTLAQLAPRGYPPAVRALLSRLDDRDGGVRRAGLKAIERVSGKNDPQVMSAVFDRANDPESFVRNTAVDALAQLADQGNPEVVARLTELLQNDRDAHVRWSATEGLGKLAVKGDSRVLHVLLRALEDESDMVRRVASRALGQVSFEPVEEVEARDSKPEFPSTKNQEVKALLGAIKNMQEKHVHEVAMLRQERENVELFLKREIANRDFQIERLTAILDESGKISRVKEFMPHAGLVTRFLETLPTLADSSMDGAAIVAPIWALRCVRSEQSTTGPRQSTVSTFKIVDEGVAGKGKRDLFELFDVFEQLSSGRMTSMEFTQAKPLDVYLHQTDNGEWGLYCCGRTRLIALLMRQACYRNEYMTVNCVLRSKVDSGYWGWHWSNFYDGGDGLDIKSIPIDRSGRSSMVARGSQDLVSSTRSSPEHRHCQGRFFPPEAVVSSPTRSTRRSKSPEERTQTPMSEGRYRGFSVRENTSPESRHGQGRQSVTVSAVNSPQRLSDAGKSPKSRGRISLSGIFPDHDELPSEEPRASSHRASSHRSSSRAESAIIGSSTPKSPSRFTNISRSSAHGQPRCPSQPRQACDNADAGVIEAGAGGFYRGFGHRGGLRLPTAASIAASENVRIN